MTQETYEVIRSAIKVPAKRTADGKVVTTKFVGSKYLQPGQLVQPGTFSDEELQSLEDQNFIRRTERIVSKTESARRKQKKGKWSINPDTLAGKDQEELLLIVLEVDPEFDTDTLKTKQQTIAQLTKDFDTEFDLGIATATDKTMPGFDGREHRPENGVTDLGSPPMSDKAKEALERARSKASPK